VLAHTAEMPTALGENPGLGRLRGDKQLRLPIGVDEGGGLSVEGFEAGPYRLRLVVVTLMQILACALVGGAGLEGLVDSYGLPGARPPRPLRSSP